MIRYVNEGPREYTMEEEIEEKQEWFNDLHNKACQNINSRDFSEITLDYLDLAYYNCRDYNFDYSSLKNANLTYADFSYASFVQSDLSGADLRYSDLSGVDLSGADLSFCKLKGCKLAGAIYDTYTTFPLSFKGKDKMIFMRDE